MKVIFWAGGRGTRMDWKTDEVPKPLLEIGDKPILWHLMKYFSAFGHNEFIVLGGYRYQQIEEFFKNSPEVKSGEFKVTVLDTGLETLTLGRLVQAKDYIKEDTFMVTYGDHLSNENLNKLVKYHQTYNQILTVSVIHPRSRFGQFEITENDKTVHNEDPIFSDKIYPNNNIATHFEEKPVLESWINAGFFVADRKLFDVLDECKNPNETMFEQWTFDKLIPKREVNLWKHFGWSQAIDSPRELYDVNKLWKENQAPWKIWQ